MTTNVTLTNGLANGSPEFIDACDLERKISNLQDYFEAFAAAVALADRCESELAVMNGPLLQGPQSGPGFDRDRYFENKRAIIDSTQIYFRWMNMAGRDGAMTLYHIAETFRVVKTLLHRCATLHEFVSEQVVNDLSREFARAFPDAEMLRDAVGHSAELTEDNEARAKNSTNEILDLPGLRSEAKGLYIAPHLMGRKFVATKGTRNSPGRQVGYDLTQANVAIIRSIEARLIAEFQKPEEPMQKRHNEAMIAKIREQTPPPQS